MSKFILMLTLSTLVLAQQYSWEYGAPLDVATPNSMEDPITYHKGKIKPLKLTCSWRYDCSYGYIQTKNGVRNIQTCEWVCEKI